MTMEIPKRTLGRTGVEMIVLGLGGEGVLRTFGREREAYALINRALDLGITYHVAPFARQLMYYKP